MNEFVKAALEMNDEELCRVMDEALIVIATRGIKAQKRVDAAFVFAIAAAEKSVRNAMRTKPLLVTSLN